jgi:hypothetical protein
VVTAPNDEMLQSVRAGAPSDAFLDLVTAKVKQALRKVCPPNGTSWTTEELEDVAGDLITAKWRKISAVVWTIENDNQLRSWVERVAVDFIADRGRETARGRLTHRVKRIIADLDDVQLAGGLVHGPLPGTSPRTTVRRSCGPCGRSRSRCPGGRTPEKTRPWPPREKARRGQPKGSASGPLLEPVTAWSGVTAPPSRVLGNRQAWSVLRAPAEHTSASRSHRQAARGEQID